MRITKSGFDFNGKGVVIDEDIIIDGPIEDVNLYNFTMRGNIRIKGLGRNGESKKVRESSQRLGHTERCLEAAPSRVNISRVVFDSNGSTGVYASPGASFVSVRDCHFMGWSRSVSIYLDTESQHNLVENCIFEAEIGRGREVIAIDGSRYNRIRENDFRRVKNGGVYVYRNCGEGGTIRHQKPKDNYITYNRFDCTGMNLFRPRIVYPKLEVPYAIILGSRGGDRLFCTQDEGKDFGSSNDDSDFANKNTVRNNTFKGDWFGRYIQDNGRNNIVA